VIGLARKLIDWRRERGNFARVTRVGEGTKLGGVIDRRAAGAQIVIGANCVIQGHLVVERNESCIELADTVLIGDSSIVDCALAVTVERNVLISYGCIIADCDNHSLYPELRTDDLASWMDNGRHDWSHSAMAPVRICEGAWIGARSMILKGVTVGAGAVVGMGSVVTRDVPARTVVAGNPARIIREIGALPATARSQLDG
jgi:acetyltransferase-like isoleucine patch superfamily enzyme